MTDDTDLLLGDPEDADDAEQPEPPRRWVWSDLEPAERRSRMAELRTWVDWLSDTFELRQRIPRCWFKHPDIREYLTALYLGWVRTYAGDPAKLTLRAEIDWATSLRSLLPELAKPACQSGQHQAPPPRRAQGDDGFDDWLAESEFGTRAAFHPAQAEASRLAEADLVSADQGS
ncbi:hypothetical protein [Streptomyces syringium]|uniref:hypothetical protein n=1 Tax=Streptomyces syringium TaxID=76729 RepID=UPI0037D79027